MKLDLRTDSPVRLCDNMPPSGWHRLANILGLIFIAGIVLGALYVTREINESVVPDESIPGSTNH